MTGAVYQLLSNSLAIRLSLEGRRSTFTIPACEKVTVVDGPIAGRRLVEVEWNNERVLVFADDLQHSEASYFSAERSREREENKEQVSPKPRAGNRPSSNTRWSWPCPMRNWNASPSWRPTT